MSEDLKEVKDELRYLRDAIVRLETTMGSLPDKLTDHEMRLRQLEKDKWPMPKLTVLIAGVGLIVSIVLPFIVK